MADPGAPPPGRLPPRSNPNLTGHAAAEGHLLAAWSAGRLHHAWLLAGRRGIGKATLAYRFARFLLANGGAPAAGLFGAMPPTSLAVAEDDPVFRRIAAGGHADLLSIERLFDEKRGRSKSEIGVDQIRGIGEFLHLTAAEGGWRIVVIDALDELNANAANALLKVLEEPPRRAMLLLVAHAPGAALATIRSRCRTLRLDPLDDDAVAAVLAEQNPDLDTVTGRALARLAEGSAGRALAIAEQGGLDLYRSLVGLIGAGPRPPVQPLHQFADQLARTGAGAAWESFVDLYPWWLSRVARAAARGALPDEVVAGEGEATQRLLARVGVDRLVEVWENVTQLFIRADALNLDRKQTVLDAILALGDRR